MGLIWKLEDCLRNKFDLQQPPNLSEKLELKWKEVSEKDKNSKDALRKIIIATNKGSSLKVGDRVPSFRLPNIYGEAVRVQNILRKSPLIISFYRGSWCPFCQLELKELQNFYSAFKVLGAELVAISPQCPSNLKMTAQDNNISFNLLSDTYNELAREFGLTFPIPKSLIGIYDELEIPKPQIDDEILYELPIPATYLVNRNGRIAYHFIDPDYTKRFNPKDMVQALLDLD